MILEELRATRVHPTTDELYQRVKKRLPKISLGTVYRNLDILVKSGQIRKLDIGKGQARFDADISHHYHIRCVRCNRIDDLKGLPQIELDREIGKRSEYEVIGYNLEFLGLCSKCRLSGEKDYADYRE